MVLRLRLQRHVDQRLAGAIDFQQPRMIAGFGEQDVVGCERLDGVHFRLRSGELENRFPFMRHFDNRAVRIFVALGDRQQCITVGQYPAVARIVRIGPSHFAGIVEDVGLLARGQERMRDFGWRRIGGLNAGADRQKLAEQRAE